MLEVFFFLLSLPPRDRIPHTLKLCEFGNAIIFKISFTSGDFKSRIYSFNRSTKINFGNASLFLMIRS